MARQKPKNESQLERHNEGITRITVGGFKSIVEEQSIEIRPLTILAGANSSGKSSIMQPLLLLKQTLEATYDPGALLLNGPNVRFTSTNQLLSLLSDKKRTKSFHVKVGTHPTMSVDSYFVQGKDRGFAVEQTIYQTSKGTYHLKEAMSQKELQDIVTLVSEHAGSVTETHSDVTVLKTFAVIARNRCFLTFRINLTEIFGSTALGNTLLGSANDAPLGTTAINHLRRIIHLPGLRGNPERTYPLTAVGREFPGTFESYVASVIGSWQANSNRNKLENVNYDLLRLGLTGKVVAASIDDTQVELRINRSLHNKNNDFEDMVSIADVGLGVSQTLPVIVALHVAEPDQLIYLEQPEIHLHPRAQSAMAEVLADAALQGKRLVVETHSSLLLLGIQTLVAEGKLPPELVKLHWFTLQEDGSTKITSADLDETGAFGDWPEDFATVTLESEDRYLDAAQKRLKGK